MRYVPIERAKSGMIVAKTIFDKYKCVLIGYNTVLTDNYIDALKKRGISGIYIKDKLFEDILIEDAISDTLRNEGVESLRNLNFDACVLFSEKVVDALMYNKQISFDLVDIRTFDDYTYRHSVNVAVLSTIIGVGFGFNKIDLKNVCIAAMLHDLGKIKISPRILNKPERLTRVEFDIVKAHPVNSYEILKPNKNISELSKRGVLYHHENEDGSGYPNGLKKDEIPLYAKIIHVVDVYDALVSVRPYKRAYPYSEAIEYLMGGCDTLFDSRVVETFLSYIPVYPKGSIIKLSDGREAVIIENRKEHVLRPKVRFFNGEELDLIDNLNITIISHDNDEMNFSDEIYRKRLREEHKLKQILVVDDTVDNLKKINMILGGDYLIKMARSGIQAYTYMEDLKYTPDLIIMDIDMPEIDGIETIKMIREKRKEEIPFFFTTSLNDTDIIEKCNELKPENYIVKPYTPTSLRRKVSNFFNENLD